MTSLRIAWRLQIKAVDWESAANENRVNFKIFG